MKKQPLIVFVVLLAASLACSLGGALDPQPTVESDILFQDDFSSSFSGWDSIRDDEGITDYENDGYRIFVNKTKYMFWSNPGLGDKLPGDVRVEVAATRNTGPDDGDFGVLCRYSETDDVSNFYQFMVTSDGYAGILKVINGDQTVISGDGNLLQDGAIKTGFETNQVRAECVGSSLKLYVNGTLVVEVEDSDLASGDVGLVAGTDENTGTDILFDNFKVTKP